MTSASVTSRIVCTFLCVNIIFLQCVTGKPTGFQRVKRTTTTGDLAQKVYTFNPRQRSNSWSPNMDVSIRKNNMNILLPKVYAGSLDSLLDMKKSVPVYRAEASPNQRLNSNGVISQKNSKGKENTLWIAVGSNPKRTEEFMQQSRLRETKDQLSTLKTSDNKRKYEVFNANDQTIRSSEISLELATKIIRSSEPEEKKSKPQETGQTNQNFDRFDKIIGKANRDVINTDITKGHNQFGISGDTLTQLRNEIRQSGVKEGTTFNNRRRSEPAIAIPNNWIAPKVPGQTSNNQGTSTSSKSDSLLNKSATSGSKSNSLPKSKPKKQTTSNTRTGQRTNKHNSQTNPSQQYASRNSRPSTPVRSSKTRNGSKPLRQTGRKSPPKSPMTPMKTNSSLNRKKN